MNTAVNETIYGKSGDIIYLTGKPDNQINLLPPAVYEIIKHIEIGTCLRKTQDKFNLPSDLFDFEDWFVDRVIKAFNENDKNTGILLSGLKGTGKTVTAKAICNKLRLPVLLVKDMFDISGFINSINQDIIIFWDEFDKFEFDEENEQIVSFLTLMDGVYTNKHKRLFILTANKDYLMPMLEARPSRIRYHRQYSSLSLAAIEAIIDKNLINKTHKPALINLLRGVQDITFDVAKEIVAEVNIFDSVEKIEEIFNYTKRYQFYNIDVFNEEMYPSELVCKNNATSIYNSIQSKINKGLPLKSIKISLYDEQEQRNYYGYILSYNEENMMAKVIIRMDDLAIEEEETKTIFFFIFREDNGVFQNYRYMDD